MAVLEAVFLDVGETIVDETRQFAAWADWMGVTRLTFAAVLGAVIARGGHHHEVFTELRPGFDLAAEQARRDAAGVPDSFHLKDLYPDVRRPLQELRDLGLRVGLAGNQPAAAQDVLQSWDLPVDVIATSQGWGVSKPDPAFFARVVREAGVPAERVLYVGDRLDNDVRAPQAAGLPTAFLRRGPWGYLMRDDEALRASLFRIDSLAELPALVAAHNASHEGR